MALSLARLHGRAFLRNFPGVFRDSIGTAHVQDTSFHTSEPALISIPASITNSLNRLIRTSAELKSIHSLLGCGQEKDRTKSAEAGYDHHYIKPIEFDALQKLLQTIPSSR